MPGNEPELDGKEPPPLASGAGGETARSTRSTAAAFRPFPLLSNPHLQTIVAAQLALPLRLPSSLRTVQLGDGDQLLLEVSAPPGWRPERGTVVLIHGLCGCARSPYVLRMARKLCRRGFRAVRVNLRGAGAGASLARGFYHSGRSEDVLRVLEELHAEAPASPLSVVGYSLGGNIALKLAGELGKGAAPLLEQVIAVSPPIDLLASSRRLGRRSNQLYERWFVRLLKRDARRRHERFPELGPLDLPRSLSLLAFDDLYTAPRCGFESALDYYARASAAPLLARIAVGCRLLFATDDPLIDCASIDDLDLPGNVEVVRTLQGGHLGFIGAPGQPGGVLWLDGRLLEWLEAVPRW